MASELSEINIPVAEIHMKLAPPPFDREGGEGREISGSWLKRRGFWLEGRRDTQNSPFPLCLHSQHPSLVLIVSSNHCRSPLLSPPASRLIPTSNPA